MWWRASRTPEGPVLLELAGPDPGSRAGGRLTARAWGPGADWALTAVPALLGADDDPTGFEPIGEVLAGLARRFGIPRIGQTRAVLEAYAPACLEQKVTGEEAYRSHRTLLLRHGDPAPGPADGSDPAHPAAGMRLPLSGEQWTALPSWAFLKAGVDRARTVALLAGARRADALERTLTRPGAEADRALQSLPGVGPWTSAEVRQRAHGDPDAWSDGDYHIPGAITLALTGEVLDNDACRELLEPYRGHRWRVQALCLRLGLPPRRGPRRSLPTHLPH